MTHVTARATCKASPHFPRGCPSATYPITFAMKFAFEILWTSNGSLEPLIDPAPVNLPSVEAARELAALFASHAPVHSITIDAEDGSVFEFWSWLNGMWDKRDLFRPRGHARAN